MSRAEWLRVAIALAIVAAPFSALWLHDQLAECSVPRIRGAITLDLGITKPSVSFSVCPSSPVGAMLTSIVPAPG